MNTKAIIAPLDAGFQPIYPALRAHQRDAEARGGHLLRLALERENGLVSVFDLRLLPGDDARNAFLAERILKTMLWLYGGFRATVAGDRAVYEALRDQYRPGGARAFDAEFMRDVYGQPFELCYEARPDCAPARRDASVPLGRHMDGCRIGFDAGGSDRKVSAVIDGVSVYSEEVVWFPKTNADPDYHYEGILSAMRSAAAHMPRVDAIGVSSAGIYIDNEVKKASLFLAVPKDAFEAKARDIYIRAARELGDVPLVVCNDGDVTALAGAMSLGKNGILGIAMGTSEAGGYVNREGNITGWLNELAFVPCDLSPAAMRDEWSGDIGCGVKYFSQDAVIKLAPAAGIELDAALSPAEKLKRVQAALQQGHIGARKIYETIGVYLGHTLAFYSLFYDVEQVLLMGRVVSGEGGDIVLDNARRVLREAYPNLAMGVELPDENARRVGQSAAAASLPQLEKEGR